MMLSRMFARVPSMSTFAHDVIRAFAPAVRKTPPTSEAAVMLEPDVTRDLFERTERLLESGKLDDGDSAAIRAILDSSRAAAESGEVPSFF